MSKRRLLLADDSVTIQKVVNLTFADEGIEVIAVGDGDQAMRKFAEAMPDLVMADVNMPGFDGYRICEIIKQDDETKHIPVILLVGSFEPFDEEEARRVGADDFLTKPFQSIRQLINKVSDLLGIQDAAGLSDEAAANSFDDTLEMEEFDGESSSNENLERAAVGDEIQFINQIGSLPTDEAQKFESKPSADESSIEDVNLNSNEQTLDFKSSTEEEIEEGIEDEWTTTQRSFEEETDDEAADYSLNKKDVRREESVYEFDGEIDFAEEDMTIESEQNFAERNKTFGTNSAAPRDALDFDDFNLLDLPQTKKDSAHHQNRAGTAENSSERNKTAASGAAQFDYLSPETIEAIADRVVEKMSDKMIKKIVREVVSQMAKKE